MSGGGWRDEAVDLGRAATGGFVFGIPLLYTMEVWWAGETATSTRLLVVLATTFGVLFVLHRSSGFRQSDDAGAVSAAMDAVEALALALVLTAIVLVVLREITTATPWPAALGKVVFEAVPFGLGIGVARRFLLDDGGGADAESADDDELPGTLNDLGGTFLGAALVGLAIAPTDEVPMLETQMGVGWILALVGVSLAISYVVVFVAGFAGEDRRRLHPGIFQHPVTETIVCYLVALVCAAGMLWLFRRQSPPSVALDRTIVLGLPAAIGGAAGRLAI